MGVRAHVVHGTSRGIKPAWLHLVGHFRSCWLFSSWSGLHWDRGMAVRFQEAEDDAQHSLRVGDTVLLYAKETNGYVFSQLSR